MKYCCFFLPSLLLTIACGLGPKPTLPGVEGNDPGSGSGSMDDGGVGDGGVGDGGVGDGGHQDEEPLDAQLPLCAHPTHFDSGVNSTAIISSDTCVAPTAETHGENQ